MKTDRLNAFTDGVLAIVITIMVLELHVPASGGLAAIQPALPLLGAYALSFINIGIFWTNHHHMLLAGKRVTGRVLWANLFLLFWLTLVPFVIRWIGEVGIQPEPVAAYGAVLMMAALGYSLTAAALVAAEGQGGPVAKALGGDFKGKVSLWLYVLSVPAAFLSPWISIAIYIGAMWLIPDRRFERLL